MLEHYKRDGEHESNERSNPLPPVRPRHEIDGFDLAKDAHAPLSVNNDVLSEAKEGIGTKRARENVSGSSRAILFAPRRVMIISGAGNEPPSRKRRRANEVERKWLCYVPACVKAYSMENALKKHFKNKHPGADRLHGWCY